MRTSVAGVPGGRSPERRVRRDSPFTVRSHSGNGSEIARSAAAGRLRATARARCRRKARPIRQVPEPMIEDGGNRGESYPQGRARRSRRTSGAEIVDVRFCDLPGVRQHFSIPIHELTEDVFEDGLGFDGSSIRGFQEIQESDMLLMPDPNTAFIDPFREHPTLNIICDVHDPITGEPYTRDPRYIAEEGRGVPARAPASPTPRTSGPRPSSSSSTTSASTRTSTPATTSSTPTRASGTRARDEPTAAEPRLQAALQGGLLPGPADGPVPGPPLRDGAARSRRSASRSRCTTTRSAPPARPRSTCASTR